MSEVLRCDECEAVGTLFEYPWRKVEYIAEMMEAFTDPRDKHFCSTKCLEGWAEEQIAQERA